MAGQAQQQVAVHREVKMAGAGELYQHVIAAQHAVQQGKPLHQQYVEGRYEDRCGQSDILA